MSHDSTSLDTGQNSDVSPNPDNGSAELLRLLESNAKAVVRMTAVMTKLSERLDAVEARLKINVPGGASNDDRERRSSDVPALALRSDGRVLLRVEELDEASIGTREIWHGVVLTKAEGCDVLDDLGDGLAAAAASIAGWLNRTAAKEAARSKPAE